MLNLFPGLENSPSSLPAEVLLRTEMAPCPLGEPPALLGSPLLLVLLVEDLRAHSLLGEPAGWKQCWDLHLRFLATLLGGD